MPTLVYRQAKLLVDGCELSASFTEGPSVEVSCEMLDETAHGDTTRINKGGLFTVAMSGSGSCEFGSGNVFEQCFNRVGVDGTVIAVFANGITPGTITDKGYAMLGVLEDFTIGGAVGALLPFSFSAQGRGTLP